MLESLVDVQVNKEKIFLLSWTETFLGTVPLISISNSLFIFSVYGSPAIKYLDRPWNKHRALKASTVQFNFLPYDELVPFLPRFRENFPNVEHYEFTETNLHSMNQINGLAHVQAEMLMS